MWTIAAQESATVPARSAAPFWKAVVDGIAVTLRKVRVQKKARTLRLEETLPLGERRFLAVVRWRDEKLLLGVTPQTITLLESPSKNEPTHGFAWEKDRSE